MSEVEKGGRPPHAPTEQNRKTVQAMASYGIPQDEIAAVLDIDPKTLRKYYWREVRLAATIANSAVAQSLFQMATAKENTASKVSAAKFWLEHRAGWRHDPDRGQREFIPEVLGKKAQAARDSETAGIGTDWGDDLTPPGFFN